MKKKDVQAARQLFGEMAVQRGYCSRKDVEKALKIQARHAEEGNERKMLGLIMLEEAMIDNMQFIELLKELDVLVHDEDIEEEGL
jgi:hypothetical protein